MAAGELGRHDSMAGCARHRCMCGFTVRLFGAALAASRCAWHYQRWVLSSGKEDAALVSEEQHAYCCALFAHIMALP